MSMTDVEKLRFVSAPFVNIKRGLKNTIQDLDEWQAAKGITTYPSLLEFLGYSSVLLLSLSCSTTSRVSPRY